MTDSATSAHRSRTCHDSISKPLKNAFFAVCLSLSVPASATAQSHSSNPEPLQQQNATALWFENWIGLSNATLNVVAPDGSMIQIFAASGTPVYQLGQNRAANAGPVLDGFYTYELTAAGDTQVKIVNPIDNGRGEAARDSHATPFAMNGSFTVSRGVIVPPEDLQEQDG